MTFSLLSLVLMFALAFTTVPALAAPGGPTITMTEYDGPSDVANASGDPHVNTAGDFRVLVEFSRTVTGFMIGDNIKIRGENAAGTLVPPGDDRDLTVSTTTPDTSSVTQVPDTNGTQYVVQTDWIAQTAFDDAVKIRITIAKDVALGGLAGGNQAATETFDRPPKVAAKVVSAALAERQPSVPGRFRVEFTFDEAPSPAPGVDDIAISQVEGALSGGMLIGTPDTSGTKVSVVVQLAHSGMVTVGIDPKYAGMTAAPFTLPPPPPPDPVYHAPPMVDIVVSGHDTAARTFRLEVTFTPQAKSDGTAGAAITGFDPLKAGGQDGFSIKDADDAAVVLTAEASRKANNSYVGVLKYDQLAKLPLTIEIDPLRLIPMRDRDPDATAPDKVTAMVTGEDTTGPVATVPGAPTGLTAVADDAANTITLAWMAPADTGGSAITGYTVTKSYMSASGSTATKVIPAGTALTITIPPASEPALPQGVEFSFTVTATNATGTGPASAAATAMLAVDPPAVANNPPSFQGATIADIVLWTGHAYTSGALPLAFDNVGDTLGYSFSPALPAGLSHLQQDAQTYVISGTPTAAVARTAYNYVVTDSGGLTAMIPFSLTVKDPVVPTAPAIVSAMEEGASGPRPRAVNTNQIVVTWTAPTVDVGAPVSGYMLRRTAPDGTVSNTTIMGAATLTHTTAVRGGLPRGTHSVQVAAVNSVGMGALSAKSDVLVADAPSMPRDLRASVEHNVVTLNWNPPSDDGGAPVMSYYIYETSNLGARRYTMTPRLSTVLAFRTPALAAGEYVFRVSALNSDDEGPRSVGTDELSLTPPTTPVVIPATAQIDSTVALPAATVPANGFILLQRNPADSGIYPQISAVTVGLANLDHLFRDRGGIALLGPGTSRDLVMSEIMWGSDSSLADDTHSQWIELYNTTGGALELSNYRLEFYSARLGATPNAIDEINTLSWGSIHGQRGRTRGEDTQGRFSEPVEIISMYRKIGYARVERPQARGEQLKGVPGGSGHGSWASSARPSLNIESTWRLATPGSQPRFTIHGASGVRRNVIISEIGNSSEDGYDWIELYNTTDGVVNLKKWELSMVTVVNGVGKETSIFQFPDNDSHRLPGKSYLVIASTDPKNAGNDLAAGIDIRQTGINQVTKGLGSWKGGGSGDDKGITALYTVNGNLKLPNDTTRRNFILRHDRGKMGKSSHFEDVVGTLKVSLRGPVTSAWTGYDANANVHYNTDFWPLHATGGPHGNVIDGGNEDFRTGLVYQRNDFGGGTGEKDLSVRGWTGIGYDLVADRNAENGGTPGYSKDALKSKTGELAGTVAISEIMLATDESLEAGRLPRATRLPQWFELYNASLTQGANINNWYLEIQNADSENVEGLNLSATIRLPNVTIPPNQTIIIVSSSGLNSGNFPEERMINLYTSGLTRGRLSLNVQNRNDPVLSTEGFYLELRDHQNNSVDVIGNLAISRRSGINRADNFDLDWDLPELQAEDGHRTSLIRVYNNNEAADGLRSSSWRRASDTNFRNVPSLTYFGNHRDYGTPGYRGGGPLPVSLSTFRPERLDTGEVVIRWVTESELNNAGFNILRADSRTGEFSQVNTALIKGRGTTSERYTYTWTDKTAKPNVVYYYQIQDVSLDGQTQTLRVSRLKGNVSAAGKATTTWGQLKTLHE